MTAPSTYDFREALYRYAPGVLMTREIEDGLAAAYAANGYQPLNQSQVLAVTGPAPAYPTGLVRLSDSNPCPDGWAIDKPGGWLS